jgi:hypothetical protein
MQHYSVQQEQQTCALQEDMQPFIEEISALRSLAAVVGVAGQLLEELDGFKHEVEHLDLSVWERKDVRVRNRDKLVRLSLSVLRAFSSRSC